MPSPALKGQKNRWGAQEKNWARIPGDSQEPGILGTCSKAKSGLRGHVKKHKELEQICPYQPLNAKKGSEGLGTNNSAFQDPPERESQLETFEEGTSKEENNVE